MAKPEPISSYEDYCRVWAEVYRKHARSAGRNLFSCYVRDGIAKALRRGKLPRPSVEVTTDEDIIGIYIVRALVAQGMDEHEIAEHTETMQRYVDEAEAYELDPTDAMRDAVRGLNTAGSGIDHSGNRARYLWAKHGGGDLVEAHEALSR